MKIMQHIKIFQNSFPRFSAYRIFILAALVVTACFAQQPEPVTEVAFKPLSAEVTRFEQPIRIGPPNRAITYDEALVFQVQVKRAEFDGLSPGIEPYLYIGANEYHIFHIDREDESPELRLTFHIRNWESLENGAPMVLTIDQGGPIRDPKRYSGRGFQPFDREMILDKR